MVKRIVDKILQKYLNTKICIRDKDNPDNRVIGILIDFDEENLEVFDGKSSMPILVNRDKYFKIEKWRDSNE